MKLLGVKKLGHGTEIVLVLHDWLGDHRNYEPLFDYLDHNRYTFVFADVRGYGLSREMAGAFTLDEVTTDLLALADDQGWAQFHLIGHSMTSLVAQNIVRVSPERVTKLVLLTPLAPSGLVVGDDVVSFLSDIGLHEAKRKVALAPQWGNRNGPGWMAFKMRRWSKAATPEAVSGYVQMFCRSPVAMPVMPKLLVLALVGEHDKEPFHKDTVAEGLRPFFPRLQLESIVNAGHYPMQEAPVATANVLMRFLGD